MSTTLQSRGAGAPRHHIPPAVDGFQHRIEGLANALHRRLDPSVALTRGGERFAGMTLLGMCRELVDMPGTRGLAPLELAGAGLQHRSAGAGTTSDFAQVLGIVTSRRLRAAYAAAPTTYQRWARRAANALDFKAISAVQVSGAPDLLRVAESGELKYGQVVDSGESYRVATYGRIVALTRQAIVNDDLRAFDRIVTAFGNSAARLENALVYSQLTANAPMADGIPLFSSSRGNATTGTSNALSFTALQAMRTAMRMQQGPVGERLNIMPRWLLVPANLEAPALQLTSNRYMEAPATGGGLGSGGFAFTSLGENQFAPGGRTALEPIVEPLLDMNSVATWYALAHSDRIDTVEYCWLEGSEGPHVDQRDGFNIDAVEVKCRLDFGAKAIDWRGMYRGAGF